MTFEHSKVLFYVLADSANFVKNYVYLCLVEVYIKVYIEDSTMDFEVYTIRFLLSGQLVF